MSLSKGGFNAVIKEKYAGIDFTVKTPTAVVGVRGTAFCIQVENKNSTYICVCNGTLNLKTSKEKTGENVKRYHHGSMRFARTEQNLKQNPVRDCYIIMMRI